MVAGHDEGAFSQSGYLPSRPYAMRLRLSYANRTAKSKPRYTDK